MLPVGQQDERGPDGVHREVSRGPLHGRDIIRVHADPAGEGGIQSLAVGLGHVPEAIGEAADGLGAPKKPQLNATWVIGRAGRELDDRDGCIAGDQV